MIREWERDDALVTTDRSRIDLDVVHRFLSEQSYWAEGRTRGQQITANDASTCFSMLDRPSGAQIGFARVVTDDVSFGWVADVFVVAERRGRGLGSWLIECIVESYEHLPRLVLGTRDAHGVYAKVGFAPLIRVERWMERWYREPNP